MLPAQFEQLRPTLEEIATRLAGRPMKVHGARRGAPARAAARRARDAPAEKEQLKAEVMNEPAVQAMLDVFPADIRDVEEMTTASSAEAAADRDRESIMNIQQMMKQAQQMQEQLQKQMGETRVEATAGGGMVTVVMNGNKQVEKITIDPEVVSKDDVEMLQDLILAALADAHRKADEEMKRHVGGMLGGMGIPGLWNPLCRCLLHIALRRCRFLNRSRI